jgi:hypothetical protein
MHMKHTLSEAEPSMSDPSIDHFSSLVCMTGACQQMCALWFKNSVASVVFGVFCADVTSNSTFVNAQQIAQLICHGSLAMLGKTMSATHTGGGCKGPHGRRRGHWL